MIPSTIDENGHEILELSLDLCTPCTLGHIWHDHTNYIAAHQEENEGEQWGVMDLLQQDADLIHSHLTAEHFKGDVHATNKFLNALDHIPF
jgi:hypothetical protein